MSVAFKPVPLTRLPVDPYKHVRFTDGMVLGVDDFDQEFCYLSERDKLLVRMLAGYGTVRGLRVFARGAGTENAEIVVSAGLALTPSGDVVRVPVDQCAKLKPWIEATRPVPPGVDDERTLEVFVTAEYASRTSDPVPIPGEPCRTEDEVLADSRTADGFRLELTVEPPAAAEEQAIAAYLKWLDTLPLVDSGGTAIPDLLASITRAAWEKHDANTGTPPAPIGEESLVFGSHPLGRAGAPLQIDRKDAPVVYMRAVAQLAEIRALSAALEGTVTGEVPRALAGPQTRILLGKASIPMVRAGVGSEVFELKAGADVEIAVDTSAAPRLVSQRAMLRAALAAAERVAKSAVTVTPGASRYVVAAAGQVTVAAGAGAASSHVIGGLQAWTGPGAEEVTVQFDSLGVSSERYVVKALASPHSGASPQVHLKGFVGPDSSQFTLALTWPGASIDPVGLVLSIEVGAVLEAVP